MTDRHPITQVVAYLTSMSHSVVDNDQPLLPATRPAPSLLMMTNVGKGGYLYLTDEPPAAAAAGSDVWERVQCGSVPCQMREGHLGPHRTRLGGYCDGWAVWSTTARPTRESS